MNFSQIQTALIASANAGEIRQLVNDILIRFDVLSARTRIYADEWLNYAQPDSDIQQNGELLYNWQIIYSAVDEYCKDFIKQNYSGSKKFLDSFFAWLEHHKTVDAYETELELEALLAIENDFGECVYPDAAIEAIYSENWQV